ncbi:MAG: phage portal protein, partial [Roseicyclus sp.]
EPPGSPLGAASFEAVRVPAQDMIHVLDRAFPGQVRGLSWLAPVALKLRDRDEASDALLMQLKVAAALTGFVTDPDGTGGGFPGQRSGEKLDLTLAPGALRVLPSGAGIEFTPVTPALAQAVDFLRSMDREIAAGAGLTYEQLTGDLSEANYSSARVGLLEFRRRAEMLQRSLIEAQLLRPLWARWISTQALAGSIPADPESLAAYGAVRFVAPGWAWVDPLKEAQGEIAAIGAGLKSRAEVVAARGRDLDELDAELEADSFRPAGRAAPAEPQDEDDEGRGRAAA